MRPTPLGVLAPLLALAGACTARSPEETFATSTRPTEGRSSRSGGEALQLVATVRSRQLIPGAEGLSGLCRQEGSLWTMGDHRREFFRVRGKALRSFPVKGVPAGLDLEGLACDDSTFYISTESRNDGRNADLILVARLSGGALRVDRAVPVSYPDNLRAQDNRGLEGVCTVAERVFSAGEFIVDTPERGRAAPLLVTSATGGVSQLLYLILTTESGKISGLDCRMRASTLELFAIERHFEVHRIVHYRVPYNELSTGRWLAPHTVAGLEGILRHKENFEGIAVDDDGSVRLVNDNHYGRVTRPSELTTLEPIAEFSLEGEKPCEIKSSILNRTLDGARAK